MRRYVMIILLLILTIAACSPMQQSTSEAPAEEIPATVPPVATDLPLPTETKKPADPVEAMVVDRLARNLGLDKSEISVVSHENVEFSDACLGITMQDVSCAQVTTPGHIIVLEADNLQYEYHTDRSGKRIQPATLALTWKRSGGIAGFCDNLMVFLSGEVYAYKCDDPADAKIETFANLISTRELEQFNAWMTNFSQVTLDVSDPKGVSDRMEVILELYGLGRDKPGEAEQQEIIAWAQDLYQKLYS